MKYKLGYFKGKKITVMGLGLLGRGVGDAKFFAEEGAELIVTDLKTKDDLAESVSALAGYKNIAFVLGEHRLEDFRDRDFILKAAGVPIDSPYIAEARKNNVPIEMSTSLFAALTPAQIVGVTGTRGKSTTTHLIYEILKESGRQVFLGGNVKGVSTLALLRQAGSGDIAVLELDSWQLQGFGERKISPHISIFTTFLPDHLNYYKGSLDDYLADKANIFLNQKDGDFLVLGKQTAPLILEKYGAKIVSEIIEAGDDNLPDDWKVNVPGLHNRYNAGLAMSAAKILNIGDETIKDTIENFKGVPGRLELVRNYNGINIYNDTTATTPDATLAGLRAFGTGKNTVLVMGGADKNLDMTQLLSNLSAHTKLVVLLAGTGSSRIENDLKSVEQIFFKKAETLEEAVKLALELCKKGDNLLFSPSFSSFGMFKNEYERGDKFNAIVADLKQSGTL